MGFETPANLDPAGEKKESGFDLETRYLNEGRDKASFEDVMALTRGTVYPYQAISEGGYKQFTPEENKDIARAVVAQDLTPSEAHRITFNGLVKVIAMAELPPDEMMARLQRIKDYVESESKRLEGTTKLS